MKLRPSVDAAAGAAPAVEELAPANLSGPGKNPWLPSATSVTAVVVQPGFLTQGSEWLIAIGIVGAAAAALIGFLDLFAIPSSTPAFRTALVHMSLNVAIVAAYIVNFAWRHGDYTLGNAVALGPLALSVISLAALGLSGYLGGKLAYRYGVRVVGESAQIDGFRL